MVKDKPADSIAILNFKNSFTEFVLWSFTNAGSTLPKKYEPPVDKVG
jgi:hypothetical protein